MAKTLREQIKICKENGNLIECDISKLDLYFMANSPLVKRRVPHLQQMTALICIKHKCQCWGGACKEERGL
jgi:hypothetical protein